MKRYETYKDSGILWLDAIPSHWHEEKLKHISTCNDEVLSEDTPDELIIHYVEISDVDSVAGINNHTDYPFANAPSRARRITRKNDVIISTVRTYLKAIATVKEDDLIVSTGFAVIRPTKVNQKYLAYSLLNDDFLGEVISKSVGVSYPAINATDLIEIKIPVPPREEQETIAAFLDHKVGQIDATIAEKEQMLKDLQAYRSAIISEAVTKGLDKNVEMKDSGIEWMGEIPSHWDIVKTSYLFDDIGSGTTPNTNDDSLYDADNGINWLQTGDLNDGHITKTSKKISQKAIEGNSTLRLYPVNSLVIALYGATIGKVGVLDIETTTNQACCVLPPSDKVLTDYAYYVFIASKKALLNLASGGGQPNISQAIIKNHRIPYPSYVEQQAITTYLDNKVEQIGKTLIELESQIHDLKSYKSALITEAVTGKIDLRDWKPKEEKV